MLFRSGLVFTLMFVALSAHADIPSPEQTVCRGKAVGEQCRFDRHNGTPVEGVCTSTQCSRMSPTGRRSYPCVRCVEGPAPKPPPPPEPEPEGGRTDKPGAAPPPSQREKNLWTSLGLGVFALGASLALSSRLARSRRGSWS